MTAAARNEERTIRLVNDNNMMKDALAKMSQGIVALLLGPSNCNDTDQIISDLKALKLYSSNRDMGNEILIENVKENVNENMQELEQEHIEMNNNEYIEEEKVENEEKEVEMREEGWDEGEEGGEEGDGEEIGDMNENGVIKIAQPVILVNGKKLKPPSTKGYDAVPVSKKKLYDFVGDFFNLDLGNISLSENGEWRVTLSSEWKNQMGIPLAKANQIAVQKLMM